MSSQDGDTYDAIVVGAGSAGCAVAARLSENGRLRVLLLEAGGRDRNPWIHIPVGFFKNIYNRKITWQYVTQAIAGLNGRTTNWPRGRVLGGTSAINGTVYIRGQASDFDHWRQLGNDGWGYQDLLPYFKKAQNQTGTRDEFSGTGGPLDTSDPRMHHVLNEAFLEGAEAAGHKRIPDFNGPDNEGVARYQQNLRGRWRHSAASAYLKPARRRRNLVVETNAQASRILIEDGVAKGVEFSQNGKTRRVYSRGDIVLCAGAVNSPQLLELSGIGNREVLTRAGVPVVHHLPGVGENLQDHMTARVVYRCNRPITMNDYEHNPIALAWFGLQWLLTGRGVLTMASGAGAFVKSSSQAATADIQYHFWLSSAEKAGTAGHAFSACMMSVIPLRPESRGHIHIANADPLSHPIIQPNYLSDARDTQVLVSGLRKAREIFQSGPMRKWFVEETTPGPQYRTDAEMERYIRDFGSTAFHPAGTCKMGPASDRMAVVDHRLRVRGITNLRVADTSIMPTITSGNTHAPAVAIGEKAAAMILEDHPLG